MEAYRIVQWDTVHETAESRKLKHISWFAMPNKHDGLTFRQVMKQPEGAALYGAWMMLLQVASKAPRGFRGWLIRNGKPLSGEDIALMTGCSQEWIDKALEYFAQRSVAWLSRDSVPWPADAPTVPASSPGVPADAPTVPASSPGVPADAPTVPASSPGVPLTEYRTVQGVQDSTERERRGSALAEVMASKTQAGVLLSQIRALEARKSDLSGEERASLRKKRAQLARVQEKQAEGDFATSPNV